MERRTVLGLVAAATMAPALAKASAAHAALDLDPTNPDDVLLILRKLAHTTGNKPIFWWIRALRQGLVDTQFTPFWVHHGGAIFSIRDHDHGDGFEATIIMLSINIDPITGKEVKIFKNPYTNKEVEVKPFGGTEPILVTYKAGGGEAAERSPLPGYKIESRIPVGPAWIEGDDVWVRTDNVFRMEPEDREKGRLIQVNDWSTYHGSLADVANPEIESAPATWAFNDINTWPSWLGMEGQPGNYVMRGIGRKVFSIDDMPEIWKAMMAKKYPDILADPEGAVQG
jgi:hypothetical protein